MSSLDKIDVEVSEETGVETRCGFGSCRPAWLQKLNNPKILCALLSAVAFLQAFAVNGINNVNTTSYERRFHLSSSTVGWVTSAFDVSAAVVGLLIGFYGSRRNKARVLSIGFFCTALGSVCMFLPHFLTGPYQWGQGQQNHCNTAANVPETCEGSGGDGGLKRYMALLVIGQLLHGVGGSTLITVGYSFIDDSVPAASSPMYLGVVNLFFLVGPVAGYVVGGQLLNTYVDFDTVPTDSLELTPRDPRWIGAWWVGFVLTAVCMLFLALSFLGFGSELPSAKAVRESRVPETHGDVISARRQGVAISIQQLPHVAFNLLRNPAFMFMSLSYACIGMISVSVLTFLVKFMQNTYGLTAARAGLMAGAISIPGAGLGQLFGAVLIYRRKPKVAGIIKIILLLAFLSMLPKAAFLLHCGESRIAGWNTPYQNESEVRVDASCNSQCQCNRAAYHPVCDTTGLEYVTPCLAGCTNYSHDTKLYTDCSCVSPAVNSSTVSASHCPSATCNRMYLFLALIFVSSFMVAATVVPTLTVILRCTNDNERTFALGGLNFLARTLGTIPGPILYGAVIDTTCNMWGEICGVRTSCWMYDTSRFGLYLTLLGYGLSLLALCFMFLAFKFYRPPSDITDKETEINSSDTQSVNTQVTYDNSFDNTKL